MMDAATADPAAQRYVMMISDVVTPPARNLIFPFSTRGGTVTAIMVATEMASDDVTAR